MLKGPVVRLLLVHERSHLATIEVHSFNHVHKTKLKMI